MMLAAARPSRSPMNATTAVVAPKTNGASHSE